MRGRAMRKMASVAFAALLAAESGLGVSAAAAEEFTTEEADGGAFEAGATEIAEITQDEDAFTLEDETVETPFLEGDDGLIQLDAPTGLEWITAIQDVDNGTGMFPSRPGYFVYNRVTGVNNYRYSIVNSKGVDVDESGTYVPDSDVTTTRLVVDHLTWKPLESDTYTFYVWSQSSDAAHKESEKAKSEEWIYAAPDEQLAPPTGLVIDASSGTVSLDHSSHEYAFKYLVEYFVDDSNGQRVQVGADYVNDASITEDNKETVQIPTDVLQMAKNYRATTIYAKARYLSKDITVVRPSELSDYSAPVNIDDISEAQNIQPESALLRSIDVKPSNVDLKTGETIKVELTFDPVYADDTAVVWSSDNPEVAAVDNGTITAVKKGTTTVWVASVSNQNIRSGVIVNVDTHSSVVTASGAFNKGGTWTLYDDGVLNVKGVSLIHGVAKDIPWSAYLDKITTLELEGVEQIKNSSLFYNMPALTTVYLPGSLYINGRAGLFYGCTSLETIQIDGSDLYSTPHNNTLVGPQKVRKRHGEMIGGAADTLLMATKTAVEIPSGVNIINARAYYGQSLPYVVLHSGVTTVKDGAFSDCRQLSFIVVENTNISIDEEAFEGCINLKDVYFAGTEAQWKKIADKCVFLKDAELHASASMPEINTITFETNGGSTVSKQMVISGRAPASLPETYLDGQVQDGWYQDAALTQRFEEGTTAVSSDITLYAKWREAKQITIVFYSGKKSDGTGSFSEVGRQTILEKQFVTAPTLQEVEGEYELEGWYRDETFDTEFKLWFRASEDMNLYARWIEGAIQEAEAVISDEVTLSYELEYTNEVEYDGRKHVVGQLDGVTKAASTSQQNPDIAVRNLKVKLNGTVITGISIKKFTYSNNKLPSNDGVSNAPMYIYPTLAYDKNDDGLKAALEKYPNLKKTLNAMMKPTYDKKEEEWNYDPLTVEITRIDLTSSTELHTKSDLRQDASLKTKDGILVWNGGNIAQKTRKIGRGDEAQTFILKRSVPGLYYQRVFTLSNGKTVVKKLSLRAGEWKVKSDDDGYYTAMKSTAFDYYCDPESGALMLNSDGEFWATEDSSGNTVNKIKAGYFTGSLPEFGT